MIQKQPGVGFFGKVRIPTIGHAAAVNQAKQIAQKRGAQLHIGLSGTSHPLTPELKRQHAEQVFQHPVMPANKHTSNIVSYLSHMSKKHDDFTLVAGSDRAEEYKRILQKYNGKKDGQGNVPFAFKKWRVHPVERVIADTNKDPTTMSRDELTKTVSASKLEKLAVSGNYKHFKAYHPDMPEDHVKKVYNQIRLGNKLAESYLEEMPLQIVSIKKGKDSLKKDVFTIDKSTDIPKVSVYDEKYKHIDSTPTHHIYKSETSYGDHFLAVDKKTGEPHVKVLGRTKNHGKEFHVKSLKASEDSTFKAHDFYHYLLSKGHIKELHSDHEQSVGGRKVWKKLSQLPHVKLHTSDTKAPIKNEKDFDKHYTHDNDYDQIKQKHFGSGKVNWYENMKNDPEYKKHMKLSNRVFVAKSSLKEDHIPIGQTFSRSLMPQIPKEKIKGFINHLKKQGVGSKLQSVDPGELKATQSEFDHKKIEKLTHVKKKSPIITSKDDHVLDGHHRWIADSRTGQKSTGYKVDLPILDLMYAAKNYVVNGLSEEKKHTFSDTISSFSTFACQHLGIQQPPPIHINNNMEQSFGGYMPSEKSIQLSTVNRHPMDALRTLAHELVHHKQNEEGRITNAAKEGQTGSPIEDEANAIAGRIMRHWAKKHPEYFGLSSLTENIAVFVVGGPCSGKDKVIKSIDHTLFEEVDVQTLSKSKSLPVRIIVNGSADNLSEMLEAFALLENNEYHTSLIFVDVENGVSKLRNEQRKLTGQRVLNESIRFRKYTEAKSNQKILEEIFGPDMLVIENSKMKNTPSDREWGTTTLTQIYKKGTPGQTKKKVSDDLDTEKTLSNDSIGATANVQRAGGFSAFSYSEWVQNPKTKNIFERRYGENAKAELEKVSNFMNERREIHAAKTNRKIRESFDKGLLDKYPMIGEDKPKRQHKFIRTKNSNK